MDPRGYQVSGISNPLEQIQVFNFVECPLLQPPTLGGLLGGYLEVVVFNQEFQIQARCEGWVFIATFSRRVGKPQKVVKSRESYPKWQFRLRIYFFIAQMSSKSWC